MGNYDDWDPEWQPVGDPVSTADDSSDYGSNGDGMTGESAPSEPSLSDTAGADQGPSEPTLGEAWAALRQQYEEAGLGAGGVTSEPESPDQVIRRWHARLELPDEYGPTGQSREESGADQSYPDESDRAEHRPAYVGPPVPEASPPNEWGISYPITANANEGGAPVAVPAGLQGWGDILGKPALDTLRNETRLLSEPIDKFREGDYAGAAWSLLTTPQRGATEVALPLYGDYLKALGEPAKWAERDVMGSYLGLANDYAKDRQRFDAAMEAATPYASARGVPGLGLLPPGREQIIKALAALPEPERRTAIDQLKSMAYSPEENQLKALEESKAKGWQKAIEDNADRWREPIAQAIFDPLWLVPEKWAKVLFAPANLPLELLGGAVKAGAGKVAERIPWAKAGELGKEAWQSGSRAVGLFYDELKPRLVDMRERVAQAIERDGSVPEAMARDIAGKLRGFQIRTPGDLLSTLVERPKGQPKILDYLPSQAIPDDAVPFLREVGEQLKGLTNPTRETVTQVFDDARGRARQWVDQAEEGTARMAPREQDQVASEAATASAGKEPSLWDIVNRKREEIQQNLSAAKEDFLRRMEAQYPPTNREAALEGSLSDLANARKDAEIAARPREALSDANAKAAGAGEPPARMEPVGPKMPSQSEPTVGPAEGAEGRLPGGGGGEPPGKPPVPAFLPPNGTEGHDLLLKVLNENKAEGAAPFQSFNDVAKRIDEARRIVDEYHASWGGAPEPIDPRVLTKQPLTKFDNPAVLDARLENALGRPTINIDSPERQAWRIWGGDELYRRSASLYGITPRQERKAWIITGLTGAGKSSNLAEPIAREYGARIIDADDGKNLIVEYNGRNANVVHEESTLLRDLALQKAVEEGDNLVHQSVGKTLNSLRAVRDMLIANGYEVHLVTLHVEPETAVVSALKRFEEKGRFVDPEFILKVGLTPRKNYDILKREGGLTSARLYTREGVARGEPPRLLDEFKVQGGAPGRSERSVDGLYASLDLGAQTAAAVARAAARARAARTSDEVTSPQTESRGGSSGFGGADGATNQGIWPGTGRWLAHGEGESKEFAGIEHAPTIGENEKARLAGKPWRVFGYSPRASDETQAGRGEGLGPPLSIAPGARARAQAYTQRADAMLAHLNTALEEWQAQALAKLTRPAGPALPFAVPQATANRWAQMLSNELRKAVGESALATNRRLSDSATQRGGVANDVGAAIRSERTPSDNRQMSNIPLAVRSLEPRPALLASASQRASTQADQAKPRRGLDRQKQSPRPPLSISQQMAQLYRGTIAGDDYWSQKRSADHDGWAMVPDDLKRALEDYWRGENLTRREVQRLMPVYRRYVAQTDYPGDMVQWITAALKRERYPSTRAGGRAYASR